MSALRWQRHGHFHPLQLLSWHGTNQTEEDGDGSCACRSVTLKSVYLTTVYTLQIPQKYVCIHF